MRANYELIVDKLKLWYKANLAGRINDACAKAEVMASEAVVNQKVQFKVCSSSSVAFT